MLELYKRVITLILSIILIFGVAVPSLYNTTSDIGVVLALVVAILGGGIIILQVKKLIYFFKESL